MIVNSSMKRVKISAKHVIYIVSALLMTVCVYLAVFTAVGKPYMSVTIQDNGQQKQTYQYQCADQVPGFAYALYGAEALLLLSGGTYF